MRTVLALLAVPSIVLAQAASPPPPPPQSVPSLGTPGGPVSPGSVPTLDSPGAPRDPGSVPSGGPQPATSPSTPSATPGR